MMQISKVSFSNEPGTEHLLWGASIIPATRSRCDSIIPATRSRCDSSDERWWKTGRLGLKSESWSWPQLLPDSESERMCDWYFSDIELNMWAESQRVVLQCEERCRIQTHAALFQPHSNQDVQDWMLEEEEVVGMSQLLVFRKLGSGGGPIFKVVLEC